MFDITKTTGKSRLSPESNRAVVAKVSLKMDPLLQLQKWIGNQAILHLLQLKSTSNHQNLTILRQPAVPTSQPIEDPEAKLGEKLWELFPFGVPVAICFQENEHINQAKVWAEREQSIGFKGDTFSATEVIFGKAILDKNRISLSDIITSLGTLLNRAISKVAPPEGRQPSPKAGPSKIRTLAIFTHGWTGGAHIGPSDIKIGNVNSIITAIAPYCTNDINVILYACHTARGQSEKEDWRKSTMESGGGSDSLAATIRDALIDANLDQASVWGHTTRGHTTTNFALRFFSATSAKGSGGQSYVDAFIFGTVEKVIALNDLEQEIVAAGYQITDQEKFQQHGYELLNQVMYDCYAQACAKLKYKDENLAEMAPVDPLGVAAVVLEYWKGYWAGCKGEQAKKLINKLHLKK
jgi:hypothetical protein